jgi:hypothetical protein
MNPRLQSQLQIVAGRQQRLQFWCKLALCWTVPAILGLAVIVLQRQTGWNSSLAPPGLCIAAFAAVIFVAARHFRVQSNWGVIAQEIERSHPDLDGRLLTASQQQPRDGGELNYLQERVMDEALQHGLTHDWAAGVPASRLRVAQAAHWVALAFFLVVLSGLRTEGGHGLLTRGIGSSITVTPGDASVERGSTLVVLARFSGALPPHVDMVVVPTPASSRRIQLVKSLADPMFGGSVPEVASNFTYHIEYGDQRTRDFTVSVFEYPRLERADADVAFPGYTKLPSKHIENTHRLSAVAGSHLDLTLRLNKPVASATLVTKKGNQASIPLLVETNSPGAALKRFPFEASDSYELHLVDAEGRTNKVQSQFVFEVLTNRTPELRLASPGGDLRPSPLEEISFEGSVWDDFGVEAYGLGYALVGKETKFIELGHGVPGKEKRPFHYLLRLEDVGVQPDSLVSWFVWADDIGPDGQVRRTTGDLFFGEVRPFEEVFREGQGMDGQQQSGDSSGQQQGESGRLADLQKQIISATWKLLRDHNSVPEHRSQAAPGPQSSNSPGRITLGPVSHILGQVAPSLTDAPPARRPGAARRSNPASLPAGNAANYEDDTTVVRDSQAQALDQAQTNQERQQDPRARTLWTTAAQDMEKALARLNAATNSPASLPEALAAEQAAYQALLRLQEHEYQVSRSRNRNQRGSSRNQQMQRQLDQMDLAQSEDRYETQRQAQAPQAPQAREQLQVMSRLQELARRQQDVNDRLKELQTALQEARTEQERAEILRRLKRLQEEEQQMLADVDELRQRMDRPENQSRMADERQQLDQTRDDLQRAAEAAQQASPSQALAAGTRAQRQFQQLHDQMRKENSSQFADELRDMRNLARELARQQEEVGRQLQGETGGERKSLSDSPGRQTVRDQLAQQKQRLTNIVERATEVSQEAENAEPVLSRQLYDTVRKFTQDSAKAVKDAQDDLLSQGLMSRSLYDQLKDSPDPDGAKMLDLTSTLLGMDLLPQANQTGQRTRASIDELKRGVEQAAESVLGDDTEALRLAEQELSQLTDQLRKEFNRSGTNAGFAQGRGALTNQLELQAAGREANLDPNGSSTNRFQASGRASQQPREQANSQDQAGSTQAGARESVAADGSASPPSQANGGGQRSDQQASGRQGQQGGDASRQASSLSSLSRDARQAGGGRVGQDGGPVGGNWDGGYAGGWERYWNDPGGPDVWPLTGADFLPWSDRLRNVEEMIDQPDLRNAVIAARERARLIRQEYKRDHSKPDWAVVQLQVMKPLVEVRDRIADELARRESREALVPLDRDPVPNRYADLVRRYYEDLGKGK